MLKMKRFKVGFEYEVTAYDSQQAVDKAIEAFMLDKNKTGTIMELK